MQHNLFNSVKSISDMLNNILSDYSKITSPEKTDSKLVNDMKKDLNDILNILTDQAADRQSYEYDQAADQLKYERSLCKYNEEYIIKNDVLPHIESTYTSHYTTQSGRQVLDYFEDLNIVKEYCLANALKYLTRYGKKNGKNKTDLLKAIHCIILLINFDFYK